MYTIDSGICNSDVFFNSFTSFESANEDLHVPSMDKKVQQIQKYWWVKSVQSWLKWVLVKFLFGDTVQHGHTYYYNAL